MVNEIFNSGLKGEIFAGQNVVNKLLLPGALLPQIHLTN